jgi:arylsulfatase B
MKSSWILACISVLFVGCSPVASQPKTPQSSANTITKNIPIIEPQEITAQTEATDTKKINLSDIQSPAKAPNILLIIADDMGLDASPWYPDYGIKKPNTPRLDALAAKGLVFDNFWSNPVCSPTRASILTGKYGVHTGVLGPLAKNDPGVNLQEYSLQTNISDNAPHDYSQAIIGKWHLSTNNNGAADNPNLMGVPYYSGFISGGLKDYYSWEKTTNGVQTKENQYATTVFTDDAINWLSNTNQANPWFLWLAYTAPHTPFHTPPESLITSLPDDSDFSKYLAAIEAMDTEIGRLLDSLDPQEQENTIIIFMGDNGTPAKVAQSPFDTTSAKGTLRQGGINVPMLIAGPGIKPGREKALINTVDLNATIAALAGVSNANTDHSNSFAPLLFGGTIQENKYIYAEINTTASKTGEPSRHNGWAIRNNQYKYISLDNDNEMFFDLDADPFERINQSKNSTFKTHINELKTQGEKIRKKD